jgi:ABC-2 type transport system permease protein
MLNFALFIVRLFKYPVILLGVDYSQFEILLVTKLISDFRRTPDSFQTMGQKKRSFIYQLFTFSIFGLLFGIAAFSVGDLVMGLTIFFTIVMVSLTMTLLSEFTTVLFDNRDNHILLPRPISNRTLILFRLTHIQVYMGFIALALSLPAAVIIAMDYGALAVIIYFVAMVLSTWLTLIFTTFIYLLLSKIVNGERFKDFLTYTQIGIAILIFGSYQLVPRLMEAHALKNITLSVRWWTYCFPPAWFAALVKLGLFKDSTTPFLILALLAVCIPIIGVFFLVRSISKGFGNILAESSSEKINKTINSPVSTGLRNKVNKLFCISEIEKAGWNFTIATTRRDRKFKQAVYPFFGIILVFAIAILKPDLTNLAKSLHENNDLRRYLFIVILGYCGSAAIMQLPFTDTPEAAWIYKVVPTKEHGHLMTGSLKAIILKFFTPLYFLTVIPLILLWGIGVLPQIILSFLCTILIVLAGFLIMKKELPFTRAREMQQKGMTSLIAFFSMIFMFLIAWFVYLTTHFYAVITILICCLVLGLIALIFRHFRKAVYKLS